MSTESASTQINPVTCHTERKKNIVIYKNQNAKNDEDEEEEKRKKEIDLYEVTLCPARFKNKQFKVEIPIVRGPKSIKASKANDLYFTFTFSNAEGKPFPTQAGSPSSMAFTMPRQSSSTPNAKRHHTANASNSRPTSWTTGRRMDSARRSLTAATMKTDLYTLNLPAPTFLCFLIDNIIRLLSMLRTFRTSFSFAVQSYNASKNYYKIL